MRIILLLSLCAALLLIVFSIYQRDSREVRPSPEDQHKNDSKNSPVKPTITDNPTSGQITAIAAGDIACGKFRNSDKECKDKETANLIAATVPHAVLIPGDVQYDGGTLDLYNTFYNKTWGEFKDITYPSIGNHEFEAQNAQGYYSYFGKRAGEPGKGFYSFDLGKWHLIALNSVCWASGGCDERSAQYQWLKNDLQNSQQPCILAYWHHPLFSSGQHGLNPEVKPFWDLLYQYHTDIVINGHDHLYERLAKQTPEGVRSDAGIREFIVGTGGRNLYGFSRILDMSEARINQSFGVLKLNLKENSYTWSFISADDGRSLDEGSTFCN